MAEDTTIGGLEFRRERLSQLMVLVLPEFGRWASAIRDFETPYGKAGIRQLEALYALRHDLLDPTIPPATALAEHFQVQRSVLTKILAKLEASGHILREPDPVDGRAWRITITEKGRLLSDYVERQYFQEMCQALGDVGEADVEALERSLALLQRVAANLGMEPPVRRIGAIPDR